MLRYLEVKQAILEKIGQQEPNTKLPSRAEMCEEYMISRTTIDRAIAELVEQGYLYAVAGSGTYVADLIADETLIRNDVMNVGVLVPNIIHDTYPGILRGIQDVMQHQNINVVICNTDNDFVKQRSSLRRLVNSHVDGMLAVPAIMNGEALTEQFLKEFVDLKVPLVFCNRGVDGVKAPVVCSNNYYGGYLATKHLLEHGYDRIAFLSVLHYQTSMARYNGYMAALWEHGLEVDETLVKNIPDFSRVELGYRMMKDLLENGAKVNGVFCFNDQLACGAINAIHEAGLRVSDDIGVIGYDNTTLCTVPAEALTSVSFKKYEIGCRAAELLLQMIREPGFAAPRETVFRPEICVRQSCLGLKR